MNETEEVVHIWDDHIVISHNTLIAVITFTVSLSGIFTNGLAMRLVCTSPHLKNSFGIVCFSHSVANFGVSVVFFVWSGPMTLWQTEEISHGFYGKKLGQLTILFWDTCVYSHLIVSINRLVIIAFPTRGPQWMSTQNTIILVGIAWGLGVAHVIPYFWDAECYIVYSPNTWTWDFATTECGTIISTYFDYYTGLGSFGVIMMLDFMTLLKIHQSYRSLKQLKNHGQAAILNRRRTMEVRFFAQSCTQGMIFFYELTSFYFIYAVAETKWTLFLTTTFAWQICHALDGLVLLIFNLRRPQGRNVPVTTVTTTDHHRHH